MEFGGENSNDDKIEYDEDLEENKSGDETPKNKSA